MTSSSDSFNILGKLVLLCFYAHLFLAKAEANEIELRRLLFNGRPYDQKVCPEQGVTKVHTNLILLQIESVNEKAQVSDFSPSNDCSTVFSRS